MRAGVAWWFPALLAAACIPGAWAAPQALPEAAPGAGLDPGPDYLAIGDAAFGAADFQGAANAYARFSPIEIEPRAQNRLAVSYFMLGRDRDAEGTFRLATSRGPDLAAAFNNLGALYYSREDFGDAEDRFRDAAERDPANPNIQDNLHAARYARENRSRSTAVAAALRGANPRLVQRIVGDFLRVEFLITPEMQAEIDDFELRGDVFLARKMFEDAVIEYERALGIDEYNPFIMNKLGLAYLQLQEFDEAEDWYRDVLRVNPHYVPALNNLGSVEQARNRFDRAMRYYSDALEIQPDYSVVLQNVGALLFAMERYEEGLQFYIQAIRADPTILDADDEGGLPTLAQAARANESMTNFYMAKVFANIGDADRTMSSLYRAVEEGFDDAELLSDAVFGLLVEDPRFQQLLMTLQSE